MVAIPEFVTFIFIELVALGFRVCFWTIISTTMYYGCVWVNALSLPQHNVGVPCRLSLAKVG